MGKPPTTAHAIPGRVRRATVGILDDYGFTDVDLVHSLGSVQGFRSVADLVEALHSSHGPEAGEAVVQAVAGELRRAPVFSARDNLTDAALRDHSPREAIEAADAENYPGAVLDSMPDEWFARALGFGVQWTIGNADSLSAASTHSAVVGGVDRLFAQNGVPYRITDGSLEVERIGEPAAAEYAIQPALARLDDPRLAIAKRHFQDALVEFRADHPRKAVDEARHAVEAAMVALIEDIPDAELPERRQGDKLFNALVAAKFPRRAQELVLGAVRLRGRTTAGHPGSPEVSPLDAEAAIASAAAALLYLAGHLGAG